jgi:hypothetical protein
MVSVATRRWLMSFDRGRPSRTCRHSNQYANANAPWRPQQYSDAQKPACRRHPTPPPNGKISARPAASSQTQFTPVPAGHKGGGRSGHMAHLGPGSAPRHVRNWRKLTQRPTADARWMACGAPIRNPGRADGATKITQPFVFAAVGDVWAIQTPGTTGLCESATCRANFCGQPRTNAGFTQDTGCRVRSAFASFSTRGALTLE